ncbi:MAG TPA: YdeI/OmpD-associated family protein [Candidatus Saccharimonadales bacterium]|nr:YdeI/OmpD-associated family protein [Candidatus Saccharimonadales bacterium]
MTSRPSRIQIPENPNPGKQPHNMSDLPKDFSDALIESGLNEFFSSYPPSHRREHLKWITEAKRPETRKERIKKTIKMLIEKRAEKNARLKKNG